MCEKRSSVHSNDGILVPRLRFVRSTFRATAVVLHLLKLVLSKVLPPNKTGCCVCRNARSVIGLWLLCRNQVYRALTMQGVFTLASDSFCKSESIAGSLYSTVYPCLMAELQGLGKQISTKQVLQYIRFSTP